MENQNIQWETWNEQPQENNEQPPINWGEQPQQQENIPTWDNQPQQEQPPINWGEENSSNNPEDGFPPFLEENNNEFLGQSEEPLKNWSIIGKLSRISIDTEIFQLNHNLSQTLEDLNELDLVPLGDDGRYEFSPKKDTELGNVVRSLVEISTTKGQKIKDCFIYKNKPLESSLNVFKGKPTTQFIFFLKGKYNSGDVILDLTSMGGPATKIMDNSLNLLTLIPGWVPFRISKNRSEEDFVAIVGTLESI